MPVAAEGADLFFRKLFAAVGQNADAYRGKALNRRIPACLRYLRVQDLHMAWQRLLNEPHLIRPTLSVALLGVTDFKRDAAVFEQFQQLAIPRLRRLERPLRVWSAACSNGPELYSIAFLLDQEGLLLPGSELLGTDCRPDAIADATSGEYPREVLDRIDPTWHCYFTPSRHGIHVAASIRRHIRWKAADLLLRPEPGPWDIILWRNMAIYLKQPEAEQVWRNITAVLRPGGHLICGKADHPPRTAQLERISTCIFRKRRSGS